MGVNGTSRGAYGVYEAARGRDIGESSGDAGRFGEKTECNIDWLATTRCKAQITPNARAPKTEDARCMQINNRADAPVVYRILPTQSLLTLRIPFPFPCLESRKRCDVRCQVVDSVNIVVDEDAEDI